MESDNNHRPGLRMDRRKFLSSATAAGVTTLVSTSKTEAEQRSDQTAPATEPPVQQLRWNTRRRKDIRRTGTEVLCQQPGI